MKRINFTSEEGEKYILKINDDFCKVYDSPMNDATDIENFKENDFFSIIIDESKLKGNDKNKCTSIELRLSKNPLSPISVTYWLDDMIVNESYL